MKDKKTMDRIKAFQKLLEEQNKEKMQYLDDEDDDYDPVVDMLLEISDLLSEAAELSMDIADILKERNPDGACCGQPCCVVEVHFDDEF